MNANGPSPASVDLMGTVTVDWKKQRHPEKHHFISSQKHHPEGKSGGSSWRLTEVARHGARWAEGVKDSCGQDGKYCECW